MKIDPGKIVKALDKELKRDILLLSARGSAEALIGYDEDVSLLRKKAFFFAPAPVRLAGRGKGG